MTPVIPGALLIEKNKAREEMVSGNEKRGNRKT